MANTQRQVIEIDVISKGLDNLEKEFSKINENSGDLGKKSQEIQKNIAKMKALIAEYGDEMPISKAKELEKLMKKVAQSSEDISDMDEIKIFGDKELEKFKKITSQIDTLNKKLKEQNNLQKQAAEKRDSRIEQLKTQGTVTHTDANNNKTKLSTEPLKGKWNTKDDLVRIQQTSAPDSKEYKVATALLQQYNAALDQYNKTISDSNTKIEGYNVQLATLKAEKANLSTETRQLTEEERALAETTNKFATEQANSIGRVIEGQQKLGKTTVETTKAVEKQGVSMGQAVRAFFGWSQVFKLGKKLIHESVKTIQEMDNALTGMTMVTGDSREETEKLIPSIQKLSKETSTAMTDVANLITEYTRQGRTLKESFTLAEETAKAAKIAGISTADSITYMTSAINGFNLAATEATRVSDVFANLAAVSATNYEQLAVALSKVSAQANLAGMSMEFTTALLAKGIETTQEAPESIGTALKTVVARMRELSDYGSTLEDGGSVNKVENALAAAGIELRDVNGEFRDLETIFNELGPKWDSLNTMQQQAIAQAVAGTRQQSRFVAIMQDWQRTQELSAEAQDSAGASAAQYAKYAQGMEAAMTNLKTSWQSFIQSLTDSKIIIGAVNVVTKLLNGVTSIISEGGGVTKFLAATLLAVGAIHAAQERMAQSMKINRSEEQLLIIENLRLQKEAAAAVQKMNAEEREAIVKKYEEEEKRLKDLEKLQQLISKRELEDAQKNAKQKKDAEEAGTPWTAQGTWHSAASNEEVELRKSLGMEETGNDGISEAINNSKAEVDNLKVSYDMVQLEQEELNKITEQYEKEIIESNGLWGQQVAEEKRSAENKQKLLEANEKMLKQQMKVLDAQYDSADSDEEKLRIEKEREKLQKKIEKNMKQQEKNTKNLTKAQARYNKMLNSTGGTWKTIGATLKNQVGSSLRSMFSFLGPIGDLLGNIAESAWDWLCTTITNLLTEEQITEEKKDQNDEEAEGSAQDIIEVGTNEVKKEQEEDITEEKDKQNQEDLQGMANDVIEMGNNETKEHQEEEITKENKKQNVEETKGLGAKLASALFGAAESASQMGPVGWIIALAILAAAGVAIGVAAASSGIKNSDANLEKNIANKQNTIYDTKKKNKELQSGVDEMESLMKKSVLTTDEEEQLKQVADGLRDQNEKWASLTDDQLLKEVKQEISKNNAVIERNIDSNYDLVLTMEDLSGSIAQQAIVSKMVSEQEKKLQQYVSPEGDMEQAKKMAESMASTFVKAGQEDLEEMLKTQEVSGWQLASNYLNPFDRVSDAIIDGVTKSTSDAVDELATGGRYGNYAEYGFMRAWFLSENTNDLINHAVAEVEQKMADKRISNANDAIVKAAAKMSEVIDDDIYTQLTTFNELLKENNDDLVDYALRKENKNLALLSDITQQSEKASLALSNLTKAGVMSSESLNNLVQTAIDSDIKNNDELKEAASGWDDKVKGTDATGKRSKRVNLQSMAKDLGLGSDASANEIKDAFLKKYAKFGEDGQIQYDDKGNIKMRGNNKKRNAQFNAINDFVASIGDFADYSKDQIKALSQFKLDINIQDAISELIIGVNNSLQLSNYQGNLEDLQRNMQFNQDSANAIMREGYEMMDSMWGDLSKFLVDEKAELEKLAQQIAKTSDEAKREELQENYNARLETYNMLNDHYTSSKAALEKAILESAGYMTGAEGDELLTRISSTRERVSGLRSKIGEKGTLETEDYAYIRDELAPMMEELAKLEGKDFSLTEFYEDLENGRDTAFLWLDKVYEDQEKLADIAFARSIETYDDQIQAIRDQVTNGELAADAAEKQIKLLEAERDTAIAQKNNIIKLSHEQLGLSKKELALQNARNKIAEIEAETNALTLKQYKEKREAQAVLWKDLDERLNEAEVGLYSRLSENDLKSLGLTRSSIKQYIKFVNGKMQIDEKWYNNLEGIQKDMIDKAVEGIQEIEQEWEDLRNQIIEDMKVLYETRISQQDEIIEHYKVKLQLELDAIQESIDKRREIYEKYFAWLNEEEAEESFEERQLQLQQAIARLSTATDSASLQQLKEYQQELADLEKEHRQEVRDRQLENINTNLDNESEAVDQYYNDLMENSAQLWKDITEMGQEGILDLMTTYNLEFQKATDLNKEYMLLGFKELYSQVLELMGKDGESSIARNEWENYQNWLIDKSKDASVGPYDKNKVYKGYSTGGLVNYTGLAMVHGSPSKPEAFLNADQTAIFSKLASNLQHIYQVGHYSASEEERQSISIENFTIKIDGVLNADNVQSTANTLVDAFQEQLKLAGYSVNISGR